jgi:hypothetical protein
VSKGEMAMARNQVKNSDASKESFLYQLDILKMEMQGLERIITRLDEMAQATKNWTITIWTGSLAIALSQSDFRKYVIVTAIAPLLFWYIDAYFRHLQRRSIYRGRKISEFLNSPKLVESFEQNKLIDFVVSDNTATQYRNLKEYKQFVSKKQTFMFPEVAVFYSVLIGISVIVGLFFLLAA